MWLPVPPPHFLTFEMGTTSATQQDYVQTLSTERMVLSARLGLGQVLEEGCACQANVGALTILCLL